MGELLKLAKRALTRHRKKGKSSMGTVRSVQKEIADLKKKLEILELTEYIAIETDCAEAERYHTQCEAERKQTKRGSPMAALTNGAINHW